MTQRKPKHLLKKRGPRVCPPHIHINLEWNRRGQQFKECDKCGAFLGFTGVTKG